MCGSFGEEGEVSWSIFSDSICHFLSDLPFALNDLNLCFTLAELILLDRREEEKGKDDECGFLLLKGLGKYLEHFLSVYSGLDSPRDHPMA